MSGKRRRFSGEQKAKIALEALRGDRTLQEIVARYQMHPNQAGAWKRQAMEGLAELFSGAALHMGRHGREAGQRLGGHARGPAAGCRVPRMCG